MNLGAAMAAREELRVRAVVTPVKAVRYTDRYTGVSEVIQPGAHFFAADHEAVRRNPQAFRRAVAPLSPAGRAERARKLEAELADIERQKRAMSSLRAGWARRKRPARASRYHLAPTARTADWRL